MLLALVNGSTTHINEPHSLKQHAIVVANSYSSCAVLKRRKAVLFIEPIPKKIRKAGANDQRGLFNGKLVIDGHNFYSDDANILGVIAFICGAKSVMATTLGSLQSINLKARINAHRELASLDVIGERTFLERFHDRFYMCTHSRKQTREFVDWLEKEQFPTALAQVPESLRIHTKLEHGTYDEFGIPMSKEAIAHRARHEKIVRQLEITIQGKLPKLPDLFDVDLTRITRLHSDAASEGNSNQVIYNCDAEMAMRRLIAHFGFDRLPATWGELNGMLDYCKYLWMASGEKFVPSELIPDWQKVGRNIDLKLAPWRVPAFDAYVANDIDKLRRIHAADKTLERLGTEWKEVQFQRSVLFSVSG